MASANQSDDDYDVDDDEKSKLELPSPSGLSGFNSPDPQPIIVESTDPNADNADGDTGMKSVQSENESESPRKTGEEEKNEAEESHIKSKKERQEEERRKMQILVSHFSEDQLNRYEMYRRAAFPKAAIKRLMQAVAGTAVPHNVVIAMSGIAKVFVGEIIEEALDIMESSQESGPLQPKHIREAVRRLKDENAIQTRGRKRMKLS